MKLKAKAEGRIGDFEQLSPEPARDHQEEQFLAL
jgi:hypothetical protein